MHEKQEENVKSLVEAQQKQAVCSDLEKSFVDQLFLNGFNRIKASMKVNPGTSYNSANVWAARAMAKPQVKQYYNSKVSALRAELHIDHVIVLKELLSFAYSDVTTYIGLTPEELKALPPEIRRCIDSIDTTTKSWLDAKTKQVIKEVTVKIKLVNKLKAIGMISRHIDFFNADNKSKGGTIDLTKASNEQLNAVLQLIQDQKVLAESS